MAFCLLNVVLPENLNKIFDELGFNLTVDTYHKNADAYIKLQDGDSDVINDSGIKSLEPVKLDIEPEKNLPGCILNVNDNNGASTKILLYGGEGTPTLLGVNGQRFHFQLRRKRYPLPFTITLSDFRMEVHPGTEVAKSYESLVEIKHKELQREVLIYMNHPLRYKNYTLYQASYSIDTLGQERSTLATVKNSGRLLPYISSGIVFSGLVTHFFMMAFRRRSGT